MDSNTFPTRMDNTCFQHTSRLRRYQIKATDDVLAASMRSGIAVLAMACGGGKATVCHLIINKFIKRNGRQSRILVITENNNALKRQFLSESVSAHVPIDCTFGEIDSREVVQVRVGLAASLHKAQTLKGVMLMERVKTCLRPKFSINLSRCSKF